MTPTPLVLLHGLGTGPEAWEPQRAHFAATRPVVTPRIREIADAAPPIDALIAATGAADVCGLSLGGLAALQYAATHDGVRRLVVCAAFSHLPASLQRKVLRTARGIRLLPSAIVRRGLASDLPQSWRSQATESLRLLSSRDVARTMKAAAKFDLRHDLPSVACPTLVLCGSNDHPNLPLSRALAEQLPNARFAVVEGAGHVANLDAPDAFTAAVEEFLC